MKVDKYRVDVRFELAVLQGHEQASRIASELNKAFHDVLKNWARDRHVIATPTSTTVDQQEETA